jgi:hypothetical protein
MTHRGTIVCELSTWQEDDHAISAGSGPPLWEVLRVDDRDEQARSLTRTVVELTKRVERVSQQLQRFRERHGAQLNHTDRLWLHLAYHEVELYRAQLSQLLRMRAAATGLQDGLQQLQELMQTVRAMVQVARQAAQTAQTTRQLLQEMRGRWRAAHAPPLTGNGASVGGKHC